MAEPSLSERFRALVECTQEEFAKRGEKLSTVIEPMIIGYNYAWCGMDAPAPRLTGRQRTRRLWRKRGRR